MTVKYNTITYNYCQYNYYYDDNNITVKLIGVGQSQ